MWSTDLISAMSILFLLWPGGLENIQRNTRGHKLICFLCAKILEEVANQGKRAQKKPPGNIERVSQGEAPFIPNNRSPRKRGELKAEIAEELFLFGRKTKTKTLDRFL